MQKWNKLPKIMIFITCFEKTTLFGATIVFKIGLK